LKVLKVYIKTDVVRVFRITMRNLKQMKLSKFRSYLALPSVIKYRFWSSSTSTEILPEDEHRTMTFEALDTRGLVPGSTDQEQEFNTLQIKLSLVPFKIPSKFASREAYS
jgi:hypothetical protein